MPRPRPLAAACVACLIFMGAGGKRFDFIDVGASSGLTLENTYGGRDRKLTILETTGNGAAIIDYDGDGLNDILITNGTTLDGKSQASSVQLYHNEGHGKFVDVTAKAGFKSAGWAQGVCAADYDNDGRIDVFVTYYGTNRLFHNEGNGRFQDVTAAAGLPVSGTRFGSGCAFVDYDRDGSVDLIVSNYADIDIKTLPKPGANSNCEWKNIPVMCGPRGLPLSRNYLYHSRGDGTFEEVSEKAGIWKPGGRYGLGIAVADFDNDGWPDLYIACDMTPSLLYHNNHDGTFEETGVASGVAYNFDGQLQAGMGVAVADFDHDGRLDIAKTNFSGDVPSLFHNDDGRFFTDVSIQAGLATRHLLGWGIAFADFDDDGFKDLVIANGHVYPEVDKSAVGETYRQQTLLYQNLGNGKFADVTAQAGPAFETPRPARGLAVGDLTGDGRQSIVIVNMNQKPSLLVDRTPRNASFVNLTLRGTKSNRSAIGARVTVEAGGRKHMDEVRSGGSFYSQNDLTLHFGLGASSVASRIAVRWPSGLEQEWTGLGVNRNWILVEGEARPR
jgi:hypothetical protein